VLAAVRPLIATPAAAPPPKSSAARVVTGGPDPRFEGRTVYTVVADAPYDDVLGAIRTVKGTSAGPSVAFRFRQACRSLVGAFTDDR